ncbi:MAG TPA: hypothetical protein VGI75_10170, partial [Pirellulales bacterium]
DIVAAQNEEYAVRFRELGIESHRISVTGSLKFDGAQGDRNNPRTKNLCELAEIRDDDVVFLAGSTQDPEEQLAIEAYQALCKDHPKLRLILVPRHPHRFDEVAELLGKSGLAWRRRMEFTISPGSTSTNHGQPVTDNWQVLLVDTVGELGAWWGAATIGFVGGSLFSSRGGQNMIEPAAYGVPVCFGPNTQNFRDVVSMLLDREAAVRVNDGAELAAFVRRCLDEPAEYATAMGRRAADFVRQQQGAVERTWQQFAPLIPNGLESERFDGQIASKKKLATKSAA